MSFNFFYKILFISFFFAIFSKKLIPFSSFVNKNSPKVTVVIVVDQFAYGYIPKISHNFKNGFREIFKNGIVYEKAFYPHAIPETTTGHNALSSGTFARYHGGVTNKWFNENDQKVRYDSDNSENAALIPCESTNGEKCNGKSAKNTMVDNLSDQFLRASNNQLKNNVFSLSLKSHPAVAMAGKDGGFPLWFDYSSGKFVTSKIYVNQFPKWVADFNKSLKKYTDNYKWVTRYRFPSSRYLFPYIDNYEFAGASESFINKSPFDTLQAGSPKFFNFARTPMSGKMLLDLSKKCINKNLRPGVHNRMLLWISLSGLDLVTHLFGPDSLEAIDTLYHIDKQLGEFLTFLKRKVGDKNFLLVLTGDHGVAPIPELQNKKGIKFAKRIIADDIIKSMNQVVEDKFDIKNMVKAFVPNSFALSNKVFGRLKKDKQDAVLQVLKCYLQKQEGIRDVWTQDDLLRKSVKQWSFESFHKNQIFKGRIGQLICLPEKYCLITNYKTGTSHSTPYEYDTHVPLAVYWKGVLRPKKINSTVWLPQLPVTLAHLLNVKKPSSSTFEVLNGIT